MSTREMVVSRRTITTFPTPLQYMPAAIALVPALQQQPAPRSPYVSASKRRSCVICRAAEADTTAGTAHTRQQLRPSHLLVCCHHSIANVLVVLSCTVSKCQVLAVSAHAAYLQMRCWSCKQQTHATNGRKETVSSFVCGATHSSAGTAGRRPTLHSPSTFRLTLWRSRRLGTQRAQQLLPATHLSR